ESGEVVLANEMARRVAHRCDIERRMRPASVARRERRADRAAYEHIAVCALTRAVAGVKVRRHATRPQHRNCLGQERVHAAHPCGVRALCADVEMNDLLARMYAAIGAARAGYRHRLAGDRSQRSLERILDRVAAALARPGE